MSYDILNVRRQFYLSDSNLTHGYKKGENYKVSISYKSSIYDIFLKSHELFEEKSVKNLRKNKYDKYIDETNCFYFQKEPVVDKLLSAKKFIKDTYNGLFAQVAHFEVDFKKILLPVASYIHKHRPCWIREKDNIHVSGKFKDLPISIVHLNSSDTCKTYIVFKSLKKFPKSLLGKGSFTKVKTALDFDTFTICAAKISSDKKIIIRKKNELNLIEKIRNKKNPFFVFTNKNGVEKIVVFEEIMAPHNNIDRSNQALLKYFYYGAIDLKRIHDHGYLHHDIKIANFDFEKCIHTDLEFAKPIGLHSNAGTFSYKPPGMSLYFSKKTGIAEGSNEATDIYSFAIMMFNLITNSSYYSIKNSGEKESWYNFFDSLSNIQESYFELRIEQISKKSKISFFEQYPQAIELLKSMLNFDQKERPALEKIIENLKLLLSNN